MIKPEYNADLSESIDAQCPTIADTQLVINYSWWYSGGQ